MIAKALSASALLWAHDSHRESSGPAFRVVRGAKHDANEAAEADDASTVPMGYVAASTMPYAKGLEFRVVAVMVCDDEVLPLKSRIEDVTDEADLQDVYDTERHRRLHPVEGLVAGDGRRAGGVSFWGLEKGKRA